MRIFKHTIFTVGLLLAAVQVAPAAEPFEDFFDGLLQRGFYEQAIWYVDSQANNASLPDEIRKTLTYRKALAEIEAARRSPNLEQREALLVSAGTHLAEFLKNNPESDRFVDGTIQRGNVLSDQARLAEAKARREKEDAAKQPHLKAAREKYEEARKVFEAANAKIREVLSSLGNVLDPQKDAKKIEYRDEMRASYIQTQLLATNCMFQRAKTLSAKDETRKKLLEQAAKEFGETYSKYKSRLAGLYARLYEAQAQQELGKLKEAISIYKDDLMLLQDQPEQFRRVKLKAAIGLVQAWQKQDEPGKAVSEIGPWLSSQQLRISEQRDEEWLELKFIMAQAYQKDAEGRKNDDKLKAGHRREALKLAVDVGKFPGDFQKQALELRTSLQGTEGVAQERPEPKTFEEAVAAGRELINEANALRFTVNKLQDDQKAAKDKAAKDDLATQIAAEEKNLQAAFDKAKAYFQEALLLADREVPSDEINSVHYFLSFLGFQAGEYWQTYARASYVGKRYPNSPSAKPCAKLALASSLRLYEESASADKGFELGLIEDTANFIARQWPTSEEAGQALVALVGFQAQQANSQELNWQQQRALLESAEQTVAKIPEGSAARSDAELKVGQTYWTFYLRGNDILRATAESADQANRPTPEQLDRAKQKAQQILVSGVNNFQGKEADYTYVVGTLSLAQVYTDLGEPAKAVALLEKPEMGLLTLIEKKNAAVSRPGIDQLIYKAAVRAYISALPTTQDPAKTESLMTSAEKAMSALKNLVGSSAEGQKQLVAIYISLANDLKQQLDNAEPATKQALAKAFEQFLTRVSESTTEANVLNWVGETFYNLGESVKEDPSFSGNAQNFYAQAIAAYQKILENADSGSTNPALLQQVRVRIAMAQRETGKFEEALATFTEVLEQSNMMVNVQVEAAKTYYLWGLNGGDPQTFYQSLMGAQKNPETKRNTIWGWGRIQSLLARYASADAEPSPFKEIFFESRYYLAQCRYQFALSQSDPAQKEKLLAMAAKDITSTQIFDAALGGEIWWSKFDTLMRKIQKDLTGEPTGLAKK